jgi:hypothetical protein
MEKTLALPNRYALILDPDAIRAVVAKAAASMPEARVCRPLDRPFGGNVNAELRKFDQEVELSAEDELDDGVEVDDYEVEDEIDFEESDF